MQTKYRGFRDIARVYRIMAAFFLLNISAFGMFGSFGWVSGDRVLVMVGYSALAVFLLWGIGALIPVIMDIEENTRRLADAAEARNLPPG